MKKKLPHPQRIVVVSTMPVYQTVIRWVVLRVVTTSDGAKASDVLGEVQAPDRPTALALAQERYPLEKKRVSGRRCEGVAEAAEAITLAVVSKLSWEMSLEERARIDRRAKVHLGSLNGRGGPPKKPRTPK